MTWELKEVEDIDCTMDDSGVYGIINRRVEKRNFKDRIGDVIRVRADLMQIDPDHTSRCDEPIVSFIGSADAVRKHLMRYLTVMRINPISLEHASYIGRELERAETKWDYVQDLP